MLTASQSAYDIYKPLTIVPTTSYAKDHARSMLDLQLKPSSTMSSQSPHVMNTFDYTEDVKNVCGTLEPAEEGTFLLRQAEAQAQVYLSSARGKLIEIIIRAAQHASWHERSWNAYQRLQRMAKGVEVGGWQEPMKNQPGEDGIGTHRFESSANKRNLALTIDLSRVPVSDTQYDFHNAADIGYHCCQPDNDRDDMMIDGEPGNESDEEATDKPAGRELCEADIVTSPKEDFLALIADLRQHTENFQKREQRDRALQLISDFRQRRSLS